MKEERPELAVKMVSRKVIITHNQDDINRYVEDGWRIISVTPGFVAISGEYAAHGKFCFVIEKYEHTTI